MGEKKALRARAAAVLAVLSVACIGVALVPTVDAQEALPERPTVLPWTPPAWHPAPQALQVLPEMDAPGQETVSGINARASFLFDLDEGRVLHAESADNLRPVASLTKLTTGLTWASEGRGLDDTYCVDARFYPTRSGAYSKLSTGECYRGYDLLGAAMVSSDNRGAYGVQVASGLDWDAFNQRMHQVSADLGMVSSSWAEPSGLDDENLSTARDMAKAAVAVSAHPTLSIAASAPSWWLEQADGSPNRLLYSTDRLVGRGDLQVLAGKTGYTDTAGYCFVGVVELDSGRRVVVSVLGASSSSKRWSDVNKLLRSVK
ncbi:MAG: serine hydrolase [Myxococcota bacterium]|nr:serine hydrolase [Myxococcota bacterium]